MSLVSGSTIYKENSEFLSDLENDVFLSQDEDELKEGQDALLGYRLEEELNRSIEKMRQMEEGTESNENICVENRLESNIAAQSLQESPTELSPSRGTSDELLEDIEMPSLSNSVCESADLVSISSGSVSPVKYSFIDWSRASSASFAEPPKRVKGDSTSFQAPAIPKTKELDVYEKIALLSAPEVPRITTLLSLNENGDSNTESVVTLHKSGDDDCEGSIHSETLDHVQEESANLTSSPVSSNHTALSFELLDMGKMNDDLLSSLLVTNSPIKKPSGDVELPASVDVPKTTSENPVNHNKVTKESKELIFVNSESKENSLSTASTSPLPSNHRMTLGTGIELLDIDEVNDSLMSSFRMAKTPILEDGEDFPLSTPLKEYEKKVLEEKLRKDKEGSVYQNDCIFNHVVNPLNETHSLGNRSKSLNDIPVKGSTVVPLDTTYACLERLLGSNSGIFDLKDYASAFNATFNPKQVKPSLSCDNVREMCKENADPNALAPIIMYKSNEDGLKIQTLNTQAAPLTNTTFDAKKSPLVNRTFQLGIDKINSTFEKSEKICTENNRMDTTFEKGSEKVSSVVNSTFDKIQAEGTDPGPLNVTYEKGEYKIASLNESVNLMDAEEKVLKLILDSTPIKPFKAPPEAVSTPKDVVKLDSSIKRTGTKDPTQSFLRRMSLDFRKMSQNLNDEKHPPISTEGGQPANIATALPSFKVGAISQQSLTSQLRRLQCGSSRSNVCGPIRALPLACLSGGSNEDKSQKNMSTPDGLSATKTSEDQAVKGAECVKPKILSFGSISSIESDRPGTPDAPISHGIMVSTPDLFRASSCSMNPRITSTPTAIPGSFSNAIIMDGQAPTPIIAPPAHKRITFQGSSSSSTSGRICQGIPTWEVKSQESCCSSQGSVFTPAKKYRGIPIKPQNVYKHSQKTIAFTSTPEERKNGQDIEENNKECKKVPVIDNINKIAVNNSAQEYERGQDEPVNVETVVSEVCTEVICDGKGNEVESEVNIIKETDNEIYRSKIDVTNELQSQLVSKNKSPVQVDYNPADNLPGEIQAGKSSEDHVEVCPKPASLKSLSESFSKPENTKTRIQNPTAGKENLENYSSQDGEEVGKCLSVKENDTRRDTEKEYFNVLNGDIIIVSDTQNICFDSTKLDCNGNSSDNDLCNTDAALCSPSPCVPSLKLQENLSAKPSATDSEFPKSNEDEFIDAEIKTNDNAFDSCTKNANINQLRDTKKSDKAETHQEKASDFVDKSGNSKKEEILPVNKRSVLQHLRLRSGNTKSSLARVSTSNKENLENDHPGIKKKLPGKLNSRGRSPALRDRVPAQQVASPNPGIQSQDIPKSSKADSKLVSNNKFQKITTRGKSPAPVSSSKCNLIKNTSKPLGSKDAKLQGKLPLKLSVSQTPSNNIGRIDTSKNELLKKSVSTVVKRTGSFSSKVLVPSVTSAAVRSRMGPFTQRSTSVTSTPSSLSAKQLAATQPSSAIPTRGILKSSSPSFPSARLPSKLPSLQSVSTKLPVLSTQTRRSTSAKGIVPPTSSRLKSK